MSCDTLRTIKLHGDLGRRFGREHRLAVETAAEAVRALCCLYPDMRRVLAEGAWRVVRRRGQDRHDLDVDTLPMRLGDAELHIVPVVRGRGGRGVGKIVVGITLVAAAFAFAFTTPVAAGATAGFLGGNWAAPVIPGLLTAGNVAAVGLSLTLSGAAALLSPQPKMPNRGAIERAESYLLSGPTNTSVQGIPVPLIYGRVRVGAVLASAGLVVEELASSSGLPAIPDGALGVQAWGRT